MKKSIPDEPGTARLSFIENNNTKKHELSTGGIAPRYSTTKNGKPDSADSSVVAPGHLAPASNRSDLLVIQPSQLLEEKASGEARRSTSGPLDEKNSIGAVTFNGRMQLLSGLPVVASNIVSQQQEVPGKDEFTVLPEKKRRKFYSGFLLGANLSIFSLEDASYSFYPFGGFFGGLELTRRWAVQAEAHVKYANNLSVAYEQTVQLETNNGYFFDQASSGIIDKSYMALEMPLVAKYKLSPTVSLLAGFRPSFILDSSSAFLGRQKQDALLAAQSSNGQSRSNISGEPALRKFDLGASVGLEWAFYRRWSFDARFSHGLLDLTPNQAFQTNKQHFNTDLQFSIRRKF
ncbi:MAG: PorT family protein [Phaeodactylibacter sp.]|nr:PorT family protein [Phaeodactylibacter sp.]